MLLTVKDLSHQLRIKPATIYCWAAQGKIPCLKIHGVLRFDTDAIQAWLEKFAVSEAPSGFHVPRHKIHDPIETLIARAKRDVYTSRPGKPDQQRAQSEGRM